MSVNIPSWYVQQFALNIQQKLQQKDSRLRSAVMTGTHKGEQASPVDQIDSIEMQEVVSRFAPMGRVDAAVDRRWVSPTSYDLPQLIDPNDELKILTDPKSTYVTNAVSAAMRKMDSVIAAAFFGTAKTGKTGTTSTTFPAAQQVAVNEGAASNVGLTVAKLRAAKKKLRAAEVDMDSDPIFCAITAEQEDDLLAEAQIISLDYNDKPVLVDGKLKSFLGFNFIHTELLNVDGSSYRRVPCWAKSGMHLGIWQDMKTSISKRNDLSGEPWQAYLQLTIGATRVEEEKIVEIKCAE